MKKTILSIFILILILLATCIPSTTVSGASVKNEKTKIKDTDKDGVPDYLEDEGEGNYTNYSQEKSQIESESMRGSSFSGGVWSATYGSDTTYGAWIADVYWNNGKYIEMANVPWIKIDGIKYEIPNDFSFQEMGDTSLAGYYLVYAIYTKTINGYSHTFEILWKFYTNTVSNAGKIDMAILHSVNHNDPYAIFAPIRIDFAIGDDINDHHFCYGSSGWSPQNTETLQFTGTPVDPTWGMKIKQQDFFYTTRWGGIKAWSTSETNYLLRYHLNEYKGDPVNYINSENTFRQDDILWTTAAHSGTSPLQCGPTIFVH